MDLDAVKGASSPLSSALKEASGVNGLGGTYHLILIKDGYPRHVKMNFEGEETILTVEDSKQISEALNKQFAHEICQMVKTSAADLILGDENFPSPGISVNFKGVNEGIPSQDVEVDAMLHAILNCLYSIKNQPLPSQFLTEDIQDFRHRLAWMQYDIESQKEEVD